VEVYFGVFFLQGDVYTRNRTPKIERIERHELMRRSFRKIVAKSPAFRIDITLQRDLLTHRTSKNVDALI
jgi:hypothetical protein